MRDDIARPEAVQDLGDRFRGVTDMHHQPDPGLFRSLHGGIERSFRLSARANDVLRIANLHARRDVPILVNRAYRPINIQIARVAQFAQGRYESGCADMHKRPNAGSRRLDHIATQARQRDGSRAAGVEERRGSAGGAYLVSLQAPDCCAPVHVDVKVDEARHDVGAVRFDSLDGIPAQVRADGRDAATLYPNVGLNRGSRFRIDDDSTTDQQVEGSGSGVRFVRSGHTNTPRTGYWNVRRMLREPAATRAAVGYYRPAERPRPLRR